VVNAKLQVCLGVKWWTIFVIWDTAGWIAKLVFALRLFFAAVCFAPLTTATEATQS